MKSAAEMKKKNIKESTTPEILKFYFRQIEQQKFPFSLAGYC